MSWDACLCVCEIQLHLKTYNNICAFQWVWELFKVVSRNINVHEARSGDCRLPGRHMTSPFHSRDPGSLHTSVQLRGSFHISNQNKHNMLYVICLQCFLNEAVLPPGKESSARCNFFNSLLVGPQIKPTFKSCSHQMVSSRHVRVFFPPPFYISERGKLIKVNNNNKKER